MPIVDVPVIFTEMRVSLQIESLLRTVVYGLIDDLSMLSDVFCKLGRYLYQNFQEYVFSLTDNSFISAALSNSNVLIEERTRC